MVLVCGIIIHEVITPSTRVVLMALLCDDFCIWTYQLLSLPFPSEYALALTDKAPNAQVWGVLSKQKCLSQLWHVRHTLNLACTLQVPWWTRTSWPACFVGCLFIYQWASECQGSRCGDTACNRVDWKKWHSVEYCFSNKSSLSPFGPPSTQQQDSS